MCARRVLLGKYSNAGQTCVAPDYVLVPKDFQETFVQALTDAYVSLLHAPHPHLPTQYVHSHSAFHSASTPSAPGVFSRLISPQAFKRVSNLLKNTKGTIVFGGETNEEDKYIALTAVKDVKWDDSLMSE
jgi:aldehyde dehydrogenase (NAD+)